MLPQIRPDSQGWRRLMSRSLDLLFPPSCVLCRVGLEDGWSLCGACDGDLPRLAMPFCQRCGEVFEGQIDGPFACPNCSHLKFSFDFARPAMVRDGRTSEMIHRLKYGRELHLAKELGRLAAESFRDPRLETALEERWPLVPVPLHRRRFQHRHFNQAEEIALQLSRVTGLPVVRGLRRIRATGHQTNLTRGQRLENLRGAFQITRVGQRAIAERPNGAVLVDDVLTTGSTVEECAKTLRRAGYRRIQVVTVMRG